MAGQQITLVVNADDFGLSEGINRGILSAFHEGILRSTSLMPNGSAFDDAVELARNSPELGVGIHLSLVDERCIAPVESVRGLAGSDGMLPGSYASFLKGYFLRRFTAREIRTEIEAQLDKFLKTGLKPTHVDSHQHLHLLPGIFEVVLDAAKNAGIPVIRIPLEQDGVGPRSFDMRGAALGFLKGLCGPARRKARESGFFVVDHFWGLRASGMMNVGHLLQTISRLKPGVNEIMCHPGFGDLSGRERYPWGYQWDVEAAGLIASSVRKLVEERGVALGNFNDVF